MAQNDNQSKNEGDLQKASLEEALAECGALITYVPLRTEVRFEDYFPLPVGRGIYEIAPRAALDPFIEAKQAMALAGDTKTAVLMPGRKFDAAGTRFGQGGGWYDRFLSAVPAEWLRIGFCSDRQFSPESLVRQEWDQAMDYVCVVSEGTQGVRVYQAQSAIVPAHGETERAALCEQPF